MIKVMTLIRDLSKKEDQDFELFHNVLNDTRQTNLAELMEPGLKEDVLVWPNG